MADKFSSSTVPVTPDLPALGAQQVAGQENLLSDAEKAAAAIAATGAASTGTLTTIAVAGYADGDHFTLPDGTHSVKFEPRAKAVSTVTLIDLADIEDNDTLVVGDGANDPVTFEAQVTGEPTFSTGSITCVAPANLKNYDSCSIGPDHTFAFNVEDPAQATGSLTFQAKAGCTDGDTFTLYSQVFEIDKTGNGVAGTNIAIDISGAGVVTASDVAGVAKTAITTKFGAETVTAGTITDGVLALESVDSSYAANAAITVTGTSCTAVGMTGGATEFGAGDANEVNITTAADVDEVADALRTAINLASIGVTAGVPVSGVIPLTSNIPGPIVIEIIHTVADSGFTHEDITGGLAFAPTPYTTLIDFSACETEADKVTAVVDAINAAMTAEDLDLVAEDGGDGATFTATNTATGTLAMTFTGKLVDTATVVSAGLGGADPVAGAVEVDMTGLTTATQGAAKICQVANALDASTLNVTCTSNAGVITATNGANGTAGNVALTEDVANAGFTVSGMTGGRNPLASRTLDDVPDSDTRVAVPPAARVAAEALAAGKSTVTFASLVAEMRDKDRLARWPSPEYAAKQASSYNRASTARDQADQTWTGWHKDSDGVGYIRTETINGSTEYVVMEHTGPGAIVRMWAPFFCNSYGVRTGPNVKIYLDGATTPVINQSWIELLTSLAWPGSYGGKPDSVNTLIFPTPFANFTARAGVLHLPIPFAQSCKVTFDAAPFYNTIGYRSYAAGTQVKTFSMDDLATTEIGTTADTLIASADFAAGTLTSGSGPVAASGTLSIDLTAGPAAVRHLEITLDAAAITADPSILRSAVLTGTFDGETTIWCPLGDFFGSSNRLNDLATFTRTTVASTGVLKCRWVMPYKSSGNITILNLGVAALTVSVGVRTDRWIWDDRSMHFHSGWMPDRVEHGDTPVDMTFVDVTGKGMLVGDGMTALNLVAKWWGEGDERIYSSAAEYLTAKFPGIHGTGTEDYYGWAGGVEPVRLDEFSTAFEANVQVGSQSEDSTLGHNVNTRTRFLDAVPFEDRLVFDMEAAAGTDQRNAYNLIAYSSAVMFYAFAGAASSRGSQVTAAARPITQLASLTAKSAYLASTGTKRLWRLGEDDAGAAAGGAGADTTAEAGGVLNLSKIGSPVYTANTANGGSSLAMSFPGASAYTLGNAGLFTGISWTDFQLSFDCKPTDMTDFRIAVCIGRYTDGAIFVYHTSNTWRVYRAGISDIITGGASTAKANMWQTVTIKRVAGTLTLYVDGVSIGNTSDWSNPANYMTIGAARTLVDALDGPFVGIIDNVAIFAL